MLPSIKACLFDTFGTVVDWRDGVAREAAAFLARYGTGKARSLAFADAWQALYGPSMEEVRAGRRRFTRLEVLQRESLETILPTFGVNASNVGDAELADLNLAWRKLDPWPDVIDGLGRIKARRIIGPLSNGNTSLLLSMAKRAGLPWDVILGSDTLRAYKPMPEAYLRAADLMGFRPDQVCMVAAHNEDLRAAQALGFKTAFVPRRTEYGPGQATDLAPDRAWDIVAEDFIELAVALG